MQEIEEKLKETTLDEKERIRLELEKQKIDDEWTKFEEKERELEERERLQPWNVDTIGQEAWSKSVPDTVALMVSTPYWFRSSTRCRRRRRNRCLWLRSTTRRTTVAW